jgi:acyl carrier protein
VSSPIGHPLPTRDTVPDVGEIRDQVCDFLRSDLVAEGASFDGDTPFNEMGVDSLSLVAILLFIERRFAVTVPESQLTRQNLKSAAALSRCVHALLLSASAGGPPAAENQEDAST